MVPAVRALTAIAGQSEQGSRITRHQVASKDAVSDNKRALCRYTLVVPAKGTEASRNSGIGGHIHHLRAIVIIAIVFINGQEKFSDEAPLHTQKTIQFHREPALLLEL